MNETSQSALIRLQLDQEVFIDAVQDGDEIEDATVATEVTSFERVDDTYVLEGAVVFAGYLTHQTDSQSAERDEHAPAFGFDSEGPVQHMHHRMPFRLRVPMKSQPRGIVNVASRINSWKLRTAGQGWIRVVAELQVMGLNGQSGYQFQCGSQEDGDLRLNTPSEDTGVPSVSSAGTNFVDTRFTPTVNSEQVELANSHQDDDLSQSEASYQVEALSEARGGHPTNAESGGYEPPTEHMPTTAGVTEELADFDRVFSGEATRAAGGRSDERSTVEEPASIEPEDEVRTDALGIVSEYEFEHQVTVPELQKLEHENARENFFASRSFQNDEFRASSAFVSDQLTVPRDSDAKGDTRDEIHDVELNRDDEGAQDLNDVASQKGGLDSDLWSFVKFSGLERSFTLRYAVVMDEETIEAVADRVGCTKADLLRLNPLSEEQVHPGQSLLAPAFRSTS